MSRKKRKDYEATLRHLHALGLWAGEIANRSGLSRTTTWMWLQQMGLSINHKPDEWADGVRAEKLRRLHSDGKDTPAIAKTLGCSDSSARLWQVKLGLKPHPAPRRTREFAPLTTTQVDILAFCRASKLKGNQLSKALAQKLGCRVQSADGHIQRLIRRGMYAPDGNLSPVVELLREVGTLFGRVQFPVSERAEVQRLRERILELGG